MDNGAEKLQWSDFDINEQIRLILIGRMADIEEKAINVQMDFESDPCMVHADKDRIAQVVVNIIDNALKYVDQKDNLTIRTILLHDNKVSVEIENSGEPIAPEHKPHIFDRFYMAEKAHTSGKGTGLGLSICKQIMDMHGQIIELTEPEVGAGFRFTLEASKSPDTPRLGA
jgi:signal transduction histidine kinase